MADTKDIVERLLAYAEEMNGHTVEICREAAQTIAALRAERDEYKAAYEDKRRLAREIDVAMHGKEGAAQQASLCDLVHSAQLLRAERDEWKRRSDEMDRELTGVRHSYFEEKKRAEHHLGSFDTPEEASAAYAMASKNHFGDFSRVASSNREGGEE